MNNRIGRWLLVSLLMALAADVAVASAASRYDRTIRALQAAEPEWRADFAGIALWQLAGAYSAEADLARQGGQRHEDGRGRAAELQKKHHWSSSVDQYASRLAIFQRRVEAGVAVSLDLSPVTEAVLQVEGEQVMLAHPRPEQQGAFEQAVLEQFCQLRDCGALTGPFDFLGDGAGNGAIAVAGDHPITPPGSASAITETIKPDWEFTADGPACRYGGIRLQFLPGDNPGAVRKLCTALFGEITALMKGLLLQQQYGVEVNWSAFELSQLSTKEGEPIFKLNSAGDLMLLRVSLLRDKPTLLQRLTPWLSERLSGKKAILELQAVTFGWQGTALDSYR